MSVLSVVSDVSSQIREVQARRFWNLKVGFACRFVAFEDYLSSVPPITPGLLKDDSEFPLLVLVEPRLGLAKLCSLGGIAFDGDDKTFVAFDERHAEFSSPTWIRIQDGRKNRDRKIQDCRKSFGKSELGLTALQGVCAYLHHPTAVSEATKDGAHIMDLSGSVHRDSRGNAACLELWGGQPRLDWSWVDNADPKSGSASRRAR